MDAGSIKDNWTEMRDRVRDWWDELSEEDLGNLDGDPNQLVPTLQERYGYTRELAEAEVEKRMASVNEAGMQNQNRSGNPSQSNADHGQQNQRNQRHQANRGNQQNQNQRDSSPSQGNQGDQAHHGNRTDSGSGNRNKNNEGNNQSR